MNTSSSGADSFLPPQYDKGWRAVVVCFGLVSFGLAQPLFSMVTLFRREFHFDLIDVIAVVFVFQYLAAAVLIAFRLLLKPPKLRAGFDFLVCAGAALALIRHGQLTYMPTWDLQVAEKVMLLAAMAGGAVLAAAAAHRLLMVFVFYAGIVSPIFGAVFIYDMINHSLPLENKRAKAQNAVSDGPAVILTVLDALSMDILRESPESGINADLFPNFSRLAARGVWYSNAIANHPLSSKSFPSFLTSKFLPGRSDGVSNDLESLPADNILDIFKDAGYRIHVYSDYLGCAGKRFDCSSYLDSARSGFFVSTFFKFAEAFGPDFIMARFLPVLYGRRIHVQHDHLIETVRTAKPGHFYLLHLLSTHVPLVFTPDGGYKSQPTLLLNQSTDFDRFEVNFRDQVRYVDSIIGEVLDALDSRPLIFMLIADHGGCWSPDCPGRASLKAIRTLEPSLVNVPVILLSPAQAPRVDADDFQLIDTAPVLCEAAGLKGCGDRGFEGVPRLENPPPPRPRQFLLDSERKPIDISLPARPVRLD